MRGIKSPLAGPRFHDLRHAAITKLAESHASDQTIMSISGHMSQAMLEYYSHIRITARRTALDAISTALPVPITAGKVAGLNGDVHQSVDQIGLLQDAAVDKLLN